MLAMLLDVDLTLVDAKKAGSKAMKRVFDELWGWPDALESVHMAGRTDHGILLEVLRARHDRAIEESELGHMQVTFLEQYLPRLAQQLELTPAEPCPGVMELLDRLSEVTSLSPGLATGNFEGGAHRKLASAGIDITRFGYGAFGDDHAQRADVVGLAQKRAAEYARSQVTCVVVGDTPRDLQAARDNGLACVSVATGPYARDELEALGPDLMLDDISDVDAFLGWLSGLGA